MFPPDVDIHVSLHYFLVLSHPNTAYLGLGQEPRRSSLYQLPAESFDDDVPEPPGFVGISSRQKGQVEFVALQSQFGGECRLQNPWQEREITLYRSGKKSENVNGELLKFPANKGEEVIAVRAGTTPEQFRRTVLR